MFFFAKIISTILIGNNSFPKNCFKNTINSLLIKYLLYFFITLKTFYSYQLHIAIHLFKIFIFSHKLSIKTCCFFTKNHIKYNKI